MNYLKTFIGAVLAGMSIAIGGLVFLSVDDRVIGSALFTVGLFTVCTMGLNLFTGKVCYVLQNNREYALSLPIIWIGNLAGTGLIALFASLTRNAPALAEKAVGMCQTKLNDNLISLFFLGILCNILIYIGVEGFKNIPHEIGKYLALLFGVMVFILCGTEHCVADMYYFSIAGMWNPHTLLCLLVISLGNAFGGVLLPLVRRLR